jgi:hypothetical protein
MVLGPGSMDLSLIDPVSIGAILQVWFVILRLAKSIALERCEVLRVHHRALGDGVL